ncbi:TetR/AcrR family transcriptional regulator [Labilibaculum sp. K2S]|uniref:TetR/AcrR family transcriptional regulator n=1 Tax=Labilibaculum sp. K2S TaxID=3056386 RepID=UPI0025A3B1F4|nr:TetR/AcrR family transcriptional regulator [Labilibaculum sp. K2S]MDM8160317.1 TetR/AcrR family transcriptional regulator [Labilibaculum sp. K2S]
MNEQKINIITTSWALFFQYGIKSISMDDIASKMGMSKKTLYNYFSNKNELINEACEWDIKNPQFSFKSDQIINLNALDQYFEFFNFINERILKKCDSLDYDLKKYYPEIWLKTKEEKIKNFQIEIIYNLQKGIKEGLYRPELNIRFISKNLVSFYLNLNTTEYQVFSSNEVFNKDMHRELTLYHLYGICTNKGIEYFKNKFK